MNVDPYYIAPWYQAWLDEEERLVRELWKSDEIEEGTEND